MRRAPIVLSLLVVPLMAACTSHTTQCVNGACTVGLSGEQTVGIDVGTVERDLRVGPIEPAAVTVASRGEQARIAVGQAGEVGGIAVRVVSVSGSDVRLETHQA